MPLLGKRILIAEDDYLIAAYVAEVIESARGNIAGRVATVREAMQVLSELHLDGAVLDLKLLNGSAIGVAHRLDQDGIPYVLLTAYPRESLQPELRDKPYLAKPFKRDEFLEVVTRHLG